MKKIVLIDGTNLIFRSYYATAVVGRLMRNSKGMPTNAIYGFISMLNKIKAEENADYYIVAFDEGKTFRHEKYKDYKSHRTEAPDELVVQFPYFKDITNALGFVALTEVNYEADDIVGSIARKYKQTHSIVAVSSDQDYLQIIDTNVTVKLLKKSDAIYYDCEKLKEDYNLKPRQIIDLKALEGDKSDNIPGVKGVGGKTALKLILEYDNIENIYNNIESIKGKLQEKLIEDKENCFFSKELVTLHCDLDYDIDKFNFEIDQNRLVELYTDLEFHSLLKNLDNKTEFEIEYEMVHDIDDILTDGSICFFEFLTWSYNEKELIGMSITNDKGTFFIEEFLLKSQLDILSNYSLITYDYKMIANYLLINGYQPFVCEFDIMLAYYTLDNNGKELSDFAAQNNIHIKSYAELYGKGSKHQMCELEQLALNTSKKTVFMNKVYKSIISELENQDLYNLYFEIELPLALVLAKMECAGIKIDEQFLVNMNAELEVKIAELENKIFEVAKNPFNINSYKELGTVLFDDLGIPYPKRKKAGDNYKTSVDILEPLAEEHKIVKDILECRTLKKLSSTFLVGLQKHIEKDLRIHTCFNQALTTTGRLSSTEPNIQNIPIRTEIGKEIRKAFIADKESTLLVCDYSQIELRVLASMSNVPEMIDAFNNNRDIHTQTASDIFNVPLDQVTDNMRRNAKAVNFGIIYGMSAFGLSKSIGVSVIEAEEFINKYFNKYAGIKSFLHSLVTNAEKDGLSRTLFNRIRYIRELKSNNYMQKQLGERLAMNTPIQGTAADIIKIAMIKIDRMFEEKKIKSRMLLQIHDELIFECLESEKELVYEIVKEAMETSYFTENINPEFNVKLDVDMKFAQNWFDAK